MYSSRCARRLSAGAWARMNSSSDVAAFAARHRRRSTQHLLVHAKHILQLPDHCFSMRAVGPERGEGFADVLLGAERLHRSGHARPSVRSRTQWPEPRSADHAKKNAEGVRGFDLSRSVAHVLAREQAVSGSLSPCPRRRSTGCHPRGSPPHDWLHRLSVARNRVKNQEHWRISGQVAPATPAAPQIPARCANHRRRPFARSVYGLKGRGALQLSARGGEHQICHQV